MGTEIFPQLLTAIRIVVITVSIIAATVVLFAGFEMRFKFKDNKEKQEEMKAHIINGLIAIMIVLLAYLILVAIGPAFRIALT